MKTKTQTKKAAVVKPKSSPRIPNWIGDVFFDVPVYRLTEKSYEQNLEAFIQKEMSGGGYYAQELYRREPDQKQLMEQHLFKSYGGCWRFNEIIGFIRLRFYFSQIRGEYWRINAKRITRTRKKIFTFNEPNATYAEEIPHGCSSGKIFDLILKYLARAQNERRPEGCCVDTTVFELIGAHVDWQALLNCEPARTALGRTQPKTCLSVETK